MSFWRNQPGALFALAAVAGLVAGLSAAGAQDADEVYYRLSENVKKVVIDVNAQLGDLDGVCATELEARTKKINSSVADLRQRGELTGTGFYALDAGNYYNKLCRDR